MSASAHRVVLVTAPREEEARRIARALVSARLAACVNVLPGLRSHYRWKGRLHEDAEILLIVKTTARRVPALVRFVKRRHSAQVPEIISLPILEGAADYLAWIQKETSPSPRRVKSEK
ncbi:MAG: divalent-cation tolerance protein CutA [Elusimicrobia bacterium]|nr:divalent-cation tolerance protein CutA [Elusimicrobiota bacterium]